MTTSILAAPVASCTVAECTNDPRSHAASESPAHHIHEIKPLDGHGFEIEPVREGEGRWLAFVDLGQADIHDADYLQRLGRACIAEAERLDHLNVSFSLANTALEHEVSECL